MHWSPRTNSRGFSFIEGIVALGVLLVFSGAVTYFVFDGKKMTSKTLTSSGCDNVAANILGSIRANDNQINVRTWMPFNTSHNYIIAGAYATDGLCQDGNFGICDTLPLFDSVTSNFTVNQSAGRFIDTNYGWFELSKVDQRYRSDDRSWGLFKDVTGHSRRCPKPKSWRLLFGPHSN